MVHALLRWPERHPGLTIVGVGLVFLVTYAASLVLLAKPDGRIVVGDAVHYYVYVRSAVYDGDLNFQNDYVRLYGLRGDEPGTEWVYEPTATGHVRNMMAIGTPLAWSPLFVAASAAVWLGRVVGITYPLNGYARLFQASAGFSGVLAAILGAWLSYRLALRFAARPAAIWATLAMWLGSNAIYYSLVSPTYSHAVSMLAVSGLFLRWAHHRNEQTPGRYATLGLLVGLASLVRWQDAVLLIVPLADAMCALAGAWHGPDVPRRRLVSRTLLNLSTAGAVALLTFSPQIAVWMVLYGQLVAMPQGEHFMQWHAPFVLQALLADWHGLLTWSPVVALGLAGLVPIWGRDRTAAAVLGSAFAVSLWANGSVIDWWAGEAYGARRFLSCFPIFVVGAAVLFERLSIRRPLLPALATVAFVAHNFLLLFQYQVFMHGLRTLAPYPTGWYGLWVARFVVPFDVVRWWLGLGSG